VSVALSPCYITFPTELLSLKLSFSKRDHCPHFTTHIAVLFLPLFEHMWASVESPMVYAVNKLTESDHLYGSDRMRTLYLSGSRQKCNSLLSTFYGYCAGGVMIWNWKLQR